ncbi:MAG: sulfatase-like hydrolase/transferase [Fimbriiglobus sp.]
MNPRPTLRPRWPRGLVALVCGWVAAAHPSRAADPAAVPVVDAHVHLWDTDRPDGLGWIAKDSKALNRSFLPKDFRAVAEPNGVRAAVVVQAGQSVADNRWLLDTTAADKTLFPAVVGNLSKVIGTDQFEPLFRELCKDPRYVGYRLSGKYLKSLDGEFLTHLKLTAAAGRTVDFLLGDYTLDDVAEICKSVPDLKIMLDHFGNVELTDRPLDPAWAKKLRAVAGHKTVFCKVSALFGRVKKQPAPRDIAVYRPVLDLAVEAFGEDRLVFGSDWPVSETTADYAAVLELVRAYFDPKRSASEKLFAKNAVRFYGPAAADPERKPAADPDRPPTAVRKPNFLFVYTDDHRWDAMGVVQTEQGKRARFPWFESPNLDRLAADGVRFRNAFVTLSLCSPSRAAFLTGRYNHANGVTNNNTPFPKDAVTHATLLRDAGYKTAYVGKWHMGNQGGTRPGFDYSASYVGQGRYQNCPFEINGTAAPTEGWVDDVSTDYAIAWMKQNRQEPFSLVLGFKSPHNPRGGNNLPERLRKLYADETSRPTPNCGVPAVFHKKSPDTGKYPTGLADNAVHLDYLRHIAGVDENIGRLLAALDDLKITDDTVVVYTSDNGFYLGEHGSGDKRSLYEESIRVPMLVRYPRLFAKKQVVDEMVLNVDLAPTFLDLAGVAVPNEMHGTSWKALAAGRKPAGWRQSVFLEYYKELGDVPTSHAVRTPTHKLVKYTGRPEWTEVFDLAADPYEIKNLAADAALTDKLEAELKTLIRAVDFTEPKAK